MIASQCGVDGAQLHDALAAGVERRRDARLSDGLPATFDIPNAQQVQWRDIWQSSARKAPIEYREAMAIATAFLQPVFDGGVAGRIWDPNARAWREGAKD